MKWEEGLTRAERVVGSLELLTRSKFIALGSDALEVIRIVLKAIRDIKVRSRSPLVARTYQCLDWFV